MYIFWLLLFVCLPIVFLWSFYFKLLFRYKNTLLLAMASALIFSIPWDIYAVKNTIWSFPKNGNMGIWIGVLPLEEYLFIMLVTLLIATMTVIIKYKLKTK